VLLASLAAAPAQTPPTRPVNETCPVMSEEPVDPNITTVYDGRTIAFCCDRCLAKFRADPQRYLPRLPAIASTVPGAEAAASAGPEPDAAARIASVSEAHEHEHDDAPEERVPWLGRVHPVLVHFPIAGLLLALLGFVLHAATRRAEFAAADVGPLAVGALSSVAAVITGNIAEDALRFGPRLHEIAERHEALSTTMMILSLGLLALRGWCWRGLRGPWWWVYGAGLLAACVLVGVTGYLGGSLVHGPEHLAW
jgi:uncharacterized membrane protein/YHS domain-containing protein